MIQYERRYQILAILLAMLAGFVDAIGFLELGGLFVSFMSGNSTRLAVDALQGSMIAVQAGSLILLFVLGVVTGSMLTPIAGVRRKVWALAVMSLLLFVALFVEWLGLGRLATGALAMAMGCANTVFQRDGEVSIGVTYMTGTLVKLGQRIAEALLGGDRTAWLPYLLLWSALMIGAIAGAAGYAWMGLGSLWFAAIGAGFLALMAGRIARGQPAG